MDDIVWAGKIVWRETFHVEFALEDWWEHRCGPVESTPGTKMKDEH